MTGCAAKTVDYGISKFPEPDRKGVYHKVKRGETIWSIAKTYDVSLDDIIKTNSIPNVAQVEENQLVFIPGAYSVKEIILDTDESTSEFIWPLRGIIIQYFREHEGNGINKGIDIQAEDGAIVKAARTGHVVFADYLSGYGYTIILDHADGYHSVYARNSKLLVKLGDRVLKDHAISQIGRSSHLAYLHFEIRRNSIEENPLHYLP